MVRFLNPFGFSVTSVTLLSVVTYIALFTALLEVHEVVPNIPKSIPKGIDLNEAWRDLQEITTFYHPYNSHANDGVRKYLLDRVNATIERAYAAGSVDKNSILISDDNVSNITFSEEGTDTSIYFEGTNIIVRIPGTDKKLTGGVMVNAHYDSVSTGFGATDDGVGVVSILQLLSYFIAHPPKRSILLLLNNGEEDYLNGARAFLRNTLSEVPTTFVNLEGAGAGGRATLFRSTDLEVTKAYRRAAHPFGSIVSNDGFKRKIIRSETDYAIFYGKIGMRGLDIAFMKPRSMYHTARDSASHTSHRSVWHMLSAAIASTEALASDTSSTFDKPPSLEHPEGSQAVWFDLFGKEFVVFSLRGMFIFSILLLTVAPILVILTLYILARQNKSWPLSRKLSLDSTNEGDTIPLYGWRGVFRFPIAFVASTAIMMGFALLIVKVNPFVGYSGPYAVWSTLLCFSFFFHWFFLRGAAAVRPTALQRFYALFWIYIGTFVLAVAATVGANKYDLGSGVLLIVYHTTAFVAFYLSILEFFFLPSKDAYAEQILDSYPQSEPLLSDPQASEEAENEDDNNEATSLLANDRQTFARYGSARRHSANTLDSDGSFSHHGNSIRKGPFKGEQRWSESLPSSLWFVEFLVLGPINIILLGQVGLLLTSAINQTLADGNTPMNLYLGIAIVSTLVLVPVTPFIHRFTYQIPLALLVVAVATLVYNSLVFPFSYNNALKVAFVQNVDCDTAATTSVLTGLDPYVKTIIKGLPSAQGQSLRCGEPDYAARRGLTQCSWNGLLPRVGPVHSSSISNTTKQTSTWITYNITRTPGQNAATFSLQGTNTRACRIKFDKPITSLHIEGSASDDRYKTVNKNGTTEVRLWHREWNKPWIVNIGWGAAAAQRKERGILKPTRLEPLEGRVVCLWSDINTPGVIPGFDEVFKFRPTWAVVTKISDGLVEGYKNFTIT